MDNRKKRLIDADALDTVPWEDKWDAIKAIKNAPTIDAVKVVRCKDCLFWRRYDGTNLGECNGMDIYQSMHANDFCSYGERKERHEA